MQIRTLKQKCLAYGALVALLACTLSAAEHKGQVKFGGLPVPGATVTATQGDKAVTAITDDQGKYSFPDLADGSWSIQVEMLGFTPLKQDVTVSAQATAPEFELKMLPFAEIAASAPPPPPPSESKPAAAATAENKTETPAAETKPEAKPDAKKQTTGKKGKGNAPPTPAGDTSFRRADLNASASKTPATPTAADSSSPGSGTPPANDPFAGQSASDLKQNAADGLLINGSVNNAAAAPFALGPAFGNNRRGARSLYNGNAGLIFDNSSLDAHPFSINGQNTARPSYTHLQGVISFGGPLKIPHLLPRNGPNFFIGYQGTRNRNVTSQPGLMPTALERSGDFSQSLNPLGQPVQLFDPTTGQPIPGNMIGGRISAQAQALLKLYPLPNFTSNSRFNFQIPLVSNQHIDAVQARLNKSFGRSNQVFGNFGMQSTRGDNPSIFGFLDTSRSLGLTASANWRHSFTPRLFETLTYTYSRSTSRSVPFFQNRENIAGQAGITGNNQEPVNWGPPQLNFSGGISGLGDGRPSVDRNETNAIGIAMFASRGRHGIQFGGDYKRQEFNAFSQQDPRGTFTFTGASTQSAALPGSGSDFAGFLLGIPDTSAIAFGNADKYFRSSIYDAFVNDDWRMRPGFTLNYGLRWEYSSPITELYGRLVNLDVLPGFSAIAPVVANQPTGALTKQQYPDSLIHPDKAGFQPRLAISWRPLPASSMVVRAGYGLYYNTSVYQSIATQMAQQAPLSKSLSVANTPANPLTLANGFNSPPNVFSNTFAVDPNFRIGFAHNWQASIQRDLPASLVMTATYLGTKGTRGMQQFLPNTYPVNAINPCPLCPSGYNYLTSNGNSTREAGQFQLRRRLHSGFASSVQYTYAKAIDDATLGGRAGGGSVLTAQNWLDLSAERGRSSFDQRHLVNIQGQYTSGSGVRGGILMTGWRGALLKGWTITSKVDVGSGLPLTPNYISPVRGTGVTGPLRPDYTGADVTAAPPGLFLNPAAYVIPVGHFGNAGRNSITGPGKFTMDASAGRNFRSSERISIDLRIDATNVLNHVTFPNWNTTVNSSQFGLPNTANQMRTVVTNLRVRF